jgi:hypothetical protein
MGKHEGKPHPLPKPMPLPKNPLGGDSKGGGGGSRGKPK